jgi:hypothetical protein
VLAAIGIDRQYQRHPGCSRVTNRVYGDQQAHQMIIYGKGLLIFALVQIKKLMIFYVLENKNILAADAVKDFCFEFTIHEPGKPGVYLEYRRAEFGHVAADTDVRRLKVIIEIDILYQTEAVNPVPFRQHVAFLPKAAAVDMVQVLDRLIGKTLTTRTGNYGQLCWF